MPIKQNLFKKSQNFISGFLPHQVRRFYRTVRTVRGLARDSRTDHFIANTYIFHFIHKLDLGHDGADAKNAENQFYEVKI